MRKTDHGTSPGALRRLIEDDVTKTKIKYESCNVNVHMSTCWKKCHGDKISASKDRRGEHFAMSLGKSV